MSISSITKGPPGSTCMAALLFMTVSLSIDQAFPYPRWALWGRPLLPGADLEEAYLYEANLLGADLGGATMSRADLRRGRANDKTPWPSAYDRNHGVGVIFEDEEWKRSAGQLDRGD